jgi:hypothetical protein
MSMRWPPCGAKAAEESVAAAIAARRASVAVVPVRRADAVREVERELAQAGLQRDGRLPDLLADVDEHLAHDERLADEVPGRVAMVLVERLRRRERLEALDHRVGVGLLGALEAQPRVLLAQEHELGLEALEVAGVEAGAARRRAKAPERLGAVACGAVHPLRHELGLARGVEPVLRCVVRGIHSDRCSPFVRAHCDNRPFTCASVRPFRRAPSRSTPRSGRSAFSRLNAPGRAGDAHRRAGTVIVIRQLPRVSVRRPR